MNEELFHLLNEALAQANVALETLCREDRPGRVNSNYPVWLKTNKAATAAIIKTRTETMIAEARARIGSDSLLNRQLRASLELPQ